MDGTAFSGFAGLRLSRRLTGPLAARIASAVPAGHTVGY
ncbi:MAG: hypothetical protein [Microvirus sp.]|nr:MAG: hypothetical protein [Microvirus sp.]